MSSVEVGPCERCIDYAGVGASQTRSRLASNNNSCFFMWRFHIISGTPYPKQCQESPVTKHMFVCMWQFQVIPSTPIPNKVEIRQYNENTFFVRGSSSRRPRDSRPRPASDKKLFFVCANSTSALGPPSQTKSSKWDRHVPCPT